MPIIADVHRCDLGDTVLAVAVRYCPEYAESSCCYSNNCHALRSLVDSTVLQGLECVDLQGGGEIQELTELHCELNNWLGRISELRADDLYLFNVTAWVPERPELRVIGIGVGWHRQQRKQTARLALTLAVAVDQGKEELLLRGYPEMRPLLSAVASQVKRP